MVRIGRVKPLCKPVAAPVSHPAIDRASPVLHFVVKDAQDESDALKLAKQRIGMWDCENEIRLLKDEELDTAVSQADAVSQP